jgi:hypothetical protein
MSETAMQQMAGKRDIHLALHGAVLSPCWLFYVRSIPRPVSKTDINFNEYFTSTLTLSVLLFWHVYGTII